MVSYLLKLLVLAVFSLFVAYSYYFTNSNNIENFDGYLTYIVIIGVVYGVYKFFQLELSEKKAIFSPFKIFSFFLLHLLILSVLFFTYNDLGVGLGIKLFFKIISFLILPIFIVFTSLSFGKKCLSKFSFFDNENFIYKFVISVGFGFFSFLFLLDIFGILGFYNFYIVFFILIGFIGFSYKEFIENIKGFFDYKIELDIEEGSYLKLISTEFLFLISTLLLSVNLISIVRPFPIGWDDLGVYMNYPHLMAEAGRIIPLGGMYAWQTFTGIGYMFGSPTQAFFLNNIGGFLSFILLVLITHDLISYKEAEKKSFINLPMLVGTLFMAMPMVVFQQAKDMKLDPGLFFVSIIAVYLLFKYYVRLDNNTYLEKVKSFIDDKLLHKSFYINNLIVIFTIGLLAGFAFSIKFTTILLISALIGVISYVRLGLAGFLGYLAIFFAIFTKAKLWGMMNVVVNPGKIEGFETNFFIISGLLGILLLAYSFSKNKKILKKFFLEFGVFLAGITIALLPWIGKNVYESYPELSLGRIISGKAESFKTDFSKIYSQEQLDKIKEEKEKQGMSSEGTTTNEDFGRYFGYEKGVNNYIKLPWNLAMQVNQGGEFTDIGFLFLALLPTILLFLPYRKKYFSFFVVIILIFELFIFVKTNNNLIDNNKLSEYAQMSEEAKSAIFQRNDFVFEDKKFNKDIYDIKVGYYISKADIETLVDEQNPYEAIEKRVIDAFYKELRSKVIDQNSGKNLTLVQNGLTDKDFELIQDLRELNINFSSFNRELTSLTSLKETIDKLDIGAYKDSLINLWKENRTFNQAISDFFAGYNLPKGYSIILLFFLVPVIIFISIIDKERDSKFLTLFKLNLIFASFYTFLWAISAFGIVWYGIVMYFSFLLAISIGASYLSSYADEKNEKEFYIKLFGSFIFSLILLVYFVNSIIPHTFNNLKGAGYKEYKTGEVTTITAPYVYHSEYLKILFNLNIDQSKKEEFLKEYITDDILKAVNGIEKMDIANVDLILKELIKQNNLLSKEASFSQRNIYKNVSNPVEKYKSKSGIYRIGTFLKYHISENNKRLLEDSLVFNFNDYIYDSNISKTVENIKKLGLDYLLVDLNAATIDKDERHALTTRYNRLLNTFTSDKLQLIETDSMCLKVALEDFAKSKKFSEDREEFMSVAGVNYESYTEDGKQINRGVKLMRCYDRISELIDGGKIDNNNYNYLLNISNYMSQNKNSFQNKQQIYAFFQKYITHGYKVLFKVK